MEGRADPPLNIRSATRGDVPRIVALLADDPIGAMRETPQSIDRYLAAFDALAETSGTHLFVAEDAAGTVIGYLQMSVTRHLSYGGARRALLEDLRVVTSYRRQGIGRRLVEAANDAARLAGCSVVQLFVHQSRDQARRFYLGLGFAAEHHGFRMRLT